MKKQETNPVKDEHRSSDKNQSQDSHTKSKSQTGESAGKWSAPEDEDADKDFADFESRGPEKETGKKPTSDPKKGK